MKIVKALINDLKRDSAAHRPVGPAAMLSDSDDDDDIRGDRGLGDLRGDFSTESELDARKAKAILKKREAAATA